MTILSFGNFLRRLATLLVLLSFPLCAVASPQKQETLIFEKVIDGATIVASGKTIAVWSVKALAPADPVSYADNLYLNTLLRKGALTCAERGTMGETRIMQCADDGADIGSIMVQFGLARAAGPYYQPEEGYAKAQQRGIWHGSVGKAL